MKIAIQQGSTFHFINEKEILRIEASEGQAIVYLTKSKVLKVSSSLKAIESILPNVFFKIHRSHIVNLRHVSKITDKSRLELVMNDKTILPISKSSRTALLKIYKKF